MDRKAEGFWNTGREIKWLDSLGNMDLLRKYLNTMHKRSRWGGIDPFEVEDWLRKKLKLRHIKYKWREDGW